jgi:hypothetical protein
MFKNLAFMMQNNAFLRAFLGCLGQLARFVRFSAKNLPFPPN